MKLSIVVPVYNEEENIVPLYERIQASTAMQQGDCELIVVDDGSSDRTVERLLELSRRDSRLHVVELRRNFGQTTAMNVGIEHARGETIVTMDGDLQNDPADIPRLLEKIDEGYDVVVGWRRDRKDALLSRTFPSKVANAMISLVTGVKVHDNGCSLKAYRRETIQSVPLYSEQHRFIPALSALQAASIAEVVVRHHPRERGVSKYGLSRIGKVLLDVITIRTLMSCQSRPLLWFFGLSLPFWPLAGVTAAIAAKTYHDSGRVDEVSTLGAALFLFLILHFFFVGLLAEMLIRKNEVSHVGPIRGR